MGNKKIDYFVKRIMDITLSFIGLVLLLPVLLIVSILIRFKLGSPIFLSR